MNRTLKLSMLVALALGTSQAMALDLGQIQVKSALGQPLLAEIPLHPASPAELQNLSVQLASSEEFARAGIVGGRTSIPLHFSVANGAGGKVIRITSSQAVDDPYLDLLLEVNSSAGKSVREFAILLDPASAPAAAPAAAAAAPARATEPSRPVHANPAPAPAATAPKAAPAAVAAAPKAAAPRTAPAAGANGQYGPVAHGQTLSSIARSTAPAGVDAQQMMLALKQANPDAFYRDNINALKSGAVLRVPTSSEAQAMTIAAAMAEVRRQNSDWRAGTPSKPAVVADTATRASASSAPTSTSTGAGDRLALTPAKEGSNTGAPGSNAGGKGDKSAASIRQDLLRSQESVASLQQQSTDLKSRLKELADINNKNEHLLSLKDNEIAELQAKLAAARKSAGMPAAAAVTTAKPEPAASAAKAAAATAVPGRLETATASTAASASSAPVSTGSTAATTTPMAAASSPASAPAASGTAPAAAAPAPVKPAHKPAVKPSPAAPVVEEPWYMQTWAWAAGGGAVVLLILLAMLGRRKPAASASTSSSSLADRFSSAPPAGKDLAGGDDVDQEELLDQLAEHPDDIYLHLELVTLYYSRRDVEHFEAAAEAMHAHITDPQQDEWQDVVHMGEDLVPGHPLFDHHPELPVHENVEALREFDIDDYADKKAASAAVPSMPPLPPGAPKKVSEYNFNFDLTKSAAAESPADHRSTSDDASVPPPADKPAAAATAETASDWHFNEADSAHQASDAGHDLGEFNDDPIDTKLDLARAYLDMGDADGARAMLGEVMKEGSQMQRDVAKRLLDDLH
jgi:pilus assembly protein FimV